MDQRPPLSAVLITYNAGTLLSECLASLAFASEIVVVDAGSTDDTLGIARRHGTRMIHHEWAGYGPQKRFAVEHASHDWVLCIDADERVPPSLAQAILERISKARHWAFEIPRANFFLGQYLRHGEGYPDWSLRLFHRRHAQWSDDSVHEKVLATGAVERIRNAGALLHHSADSLETYLEKQNRYTTLQAENLHARGESAGLARIVFSPVLRFLKFYLIRGGFLDGLPGLVHVGIGCFNSFVKYVKLRALRDERP
jgi:glycosyltransferase involved in cell wall biosynthesis